MDRRTTKGEQDVARDDAGAGLQLVRSGTFDELMRRSICGSLAALCVLAVSAQVAMGVPLDLRSASTARSTADSKRGVASAQYLVSDPSKLSRLGASWAYDWSATAPAATTALTWVPMISGAGALTPATIAQLRAAGRAGRVRYLLGFNEPDSAAQSNLTPQQAAALWPQLERTGLLLGSPAPATPADGWLAAFMALAQQRHLRVDFIAPHHHHTAGVPAGAGAAARAIGAVGEDARRAPRALNGG